MKESRTKVTKLIDCMWSTLTIIVFIKNSRIQSLQSYKEQCIKKTIMSVALSATSKNVPLLIYDGYSYIIDKQNDQRIFWKCEHARKFKWRGPLHTDLNNIFIKTVGDHENHTADPRSVPIREYYDRLRKESQQNQTNPHNILTQANIGVKDELRVQLTSNDHLKRNVRRWRQVINAVSTPSTINFPVVPDKYNRTTSDTTFLRKDTGPISD